MMLLKRQLVHAQLQLEIYIKVTSLLNHGPSLIPIRKPFSESCTGISSHGLTLFNIIYYTSYLMVNSSFCLCFNYSQDKY